MNRLSLSSIMISYGLTDQFMKGHIRREQFRFYSEVVHLTGIGTYFSWTFDSAANCAVSFSGFTNGWGQYDAIMMFGNLENNTKCRTQNVGLIVSWRAIQGSCMGLYHINLDRSATCILSKNWSIFISIFGLLCHWKNRS